MGNYGLVLWNISSALLAMWIVHRYLGAFFNKRKINILAIISNMFFVLFQFGINCCNEVSPILVLFCNVVLVWLISLNGYQKAVKSKLLYTILFYTLWMILEIVVYFFLQFFPVNDMGFEMLGSVISKLLAIIMVGMIEHLFPEFHFETVPIMELIRVILIPICSIGIAHIVFMDGTNNVSTLIIYSILVLMNIVIFEIHQKLSNSILIQREKVAFEQQINMITKNTEEKKHAMNLFYEERHNLKNQLIVVREYLNQNKLQELETLINQIICKTNVEEEKVVYSGNDIVDAIVNSKYGVAKELGIRFDLEIFLPNELAIQPCELGIIVGNLLDNAIEATAKCDADVKRICVVMTVKKQELVIIVKNPYVNELRRNKYGELISTKRESNHGYGISSVRKVVEKYQGELLIETDNNEFAVMIIVNAG